MISRPKKRLKIQDLTALLVIDWWSEIDSDLPEWSTRVKQELQNMEFETVIVSNFEIAPTLEDQAQFNTIQQYGWYCYTPAILAPLLKECRQRKANPFLNAVYGPKSWMLLDINSIVMHLESSSSTHLKNWLVVGGGWGGCIHNRPVGFHTLKTVPYNFFITDWSVYSRDCSFGRTALHSDTLIWLDHDQGLYQLSCSQSNDHHSLSF